jgi:tetratricopeptide (TPR) repeat protein
MLWMYAGLTLASDTPPAAPILLPDNVRRYPGLIDALQKGHIETAITIIQGIENPQADDIKMLAMGVRLMLDHLYVIDATDFQMPTVRAKMDAALLVADRAIAVNPESPDAWAAKALALNWAYRNDEALSAITYAHSLDPNHPGVLAVAAEINVERGLYPEAQALLDEAIAQAQSANPPNRSALARAYYVRGNIEQILGHADLAIQAYESAWAISASPYDINDPWMVVPPGYILYQLGPIYLFQGKGDLALQQYTEALSVDKQDAFLYYLRGRVYRYDGDLVSAAAAFQTCIDMDAQQWRCWRNLGQMAYENARWQDTLRSFQPIIGDNSQISDDYYYWGTAAIEMNLCNRAVPYLQRGLDLVQIATGKPQWTAPQFTDALDRCSPV